jgi:hypothetical protein
LYEKSIKGSQKCVGNYTDRISEYKERLSTYKCQKDALLAELVDMKRKERHRRVYMAELQCRLEEVGVDEDILLRFCGLPVTESLTMAL